MNLVQWEEALSCTEDNNRFLQGISRPNRSKARLYKKSTCRQCDDRRLVGEDYEDIKKEDFGLNADGRGLKTCSADLVDELRANGFTDVITAETVSITRLPADCFSYSYHSNHCRDTGESGDICCTESPVQVSPASPARVRRRRSPKIVISKIVISKIVSPKRVSPRIQEIEMSPNLEDSGSKGKLGKKF